ncbi:MAG: hypothetical protein LBL83_12220, partial [Clostridiales bacterium]|nr:hypothetical protein [Clostridiales bacterium]
MNQEKIANGWQIRQLPDDFPLDGGFPAEEARGGEWLPAAKFPAQIHDVLRQNGLIGEPWLPGKAEEYAWVAQKSWLYRVAFSCGEPGRRSKLCFGGLDTVCRVFLNGEQVLYADDSYVPWEADVTGRLKGENELLLLFPSVARLADAVELPAELSGRAPKTLGIRKMPQDFRDYLGPKPCFTRVGAYRDVTLKQYGAAGFSNCWARASLNGALDAGAVIFHAEGFLLAKAGNGAAEGATAGAMAGDRAAEGAGNGAAERAGGGAKEAFLELRVRACGEGGGGPA